MLLLDTHVVLWWLGEPSKLGADALSAIADPRQRTFLSAVVVWEIRVKASLGKLSLPDEFRQVLSAERFEELPIRAAHAHRLADLPRHHRDPFDRMLVAQALEEGLTIVTRDARVAEYGARVLAA